MGTLVGHVAPGFGFLLLGLWQLFNNIKFHSLHPSTFVSPPWFPSPILNRYLEPILIIAVSAASIAMELFIGPDRHQPLDPDWTIPSNHLHNLEHAAISLTFLLYALFSILLDPSRARSRPPPPPALRAARAGLTQLLAAAAFGQQLLLFHLHSSDHMGVEGQYHWLLQLVIAVSLSTSLLGIALPASLLVAFARSVSIAFQGVWFIAMGYALWTPALIPKGCFINSEDGHSVVRCHDEASLHRAKSLVNIEFSYFLAGMLVFSVVAYLVVSSWYPEEPQYVSLGREAEEESEEDLESHKSDSFVHMGTKGMRSLDLER